MKTYLELSRRGRLRRVRQLARTALDTYGLSEARLTFLQYFANIIYRVDVKEGHDEEDRSSPYFPNRYLLRIHGMDDATAVASELTWLAALSQEAGLPVPSPVSTPSGEFVTRVTTSGIPKGRTVSLMHWLDGQRLHRALKPKHLIALGQVVAQLHAFSAHWQPPAGFQRPEWDWEAQLGGSMFKHSLEELLDTMPQPIQEPFQIISREAKQVMQLLGKGPDAYGLIHADLYPENVLFKHGKAYPIDFEDCGYGYWLWDIAVALCQWAWGEDWQPMRDAFKEGYTHIRTLPETQWAQLDLFVAIQFATMVLWASEFLMNDPMRTSEHERWRGDNVNKLLLYIERKQ